MPNSNPKLKVIFRGEEFEVQTIQADLIRYETTARKHGWGMLGQDDKFSTVSWTSFLAWSAARRLGYIPESVTWEEYADTVEDVDIVGSTEVNPTQPAPEFAN